jgi:PAS domain S-box-containing protein
MVRNRRQHASDLRALQTEVALRKQAEENAHALLEGSPAAIITAGPDGRIEMTNQAARRILGLGTESGVGQTIGHYFPLLNALAKSKQPGIMPAAMIEGRGVRCNGEMFYAQMWLSAYISSAGPKLTAVVADVSEQLRDREELGLRQLLMNSKIIASAVSHEVRNLAAAAEVLHGNIRKSSGIQGNPDLEALGQLLLALRKLSSAEMPRASDNPLMGVDVNSLLSDLDIILSSTARASKVRLRWEIAGDLPRVRADHSGLLQVLLNLTQNSIRTLEGSPQGHLKIAAYELDGSVVMRVSDNGPGVAKPETLFHPFQSGAASSGLGLYVSRAIVRTYGGELQYSRRADETAFVIQLPAVATDLSAHA